MIFICFLPLNKSFIIKQIIPIIALFFGLTLGYLLIPAQEPIKSTKQCTLLSDSCHFLLDWGELVVDIGQTPIQLEEEIAVKFTFPSSYQWTEATVTGVNMFMGKLPIVVETTYNVAEQTAIQGVFFLGSCSEPNMRWQLKVVLRHTDGNEEARFINFSTTHR